jgi:hypothetical protein
VSYWSPARFFFISLKLFLSPPYTLAVLRIKLIALHILGKRSTTELHTPVHSFF